MQVYDYEKLLKDFPKMSDGRVRHEFSRVHNKRKQIEFSLDCGTITENEYFCFIEPLDMAYQYLSGYLAISYMMEHGYDVTWSDRLTKRNIS